MSDPRRPGNPAGEVTLESNGEPIVIRVWNFQTSHIELKPNHGPGLIREVIPRIRGRRDRFFVHMIGMASHRGTDRQNQDLAQGRVDNVRNFLIRTLQEMQIPFPESRIPSWVAEGERRATPGAGENSNLDFDRAVEIQITTLQAPTINVRPLRPRVQEFRDELELTLQPFFKICVQNGIDLNVPGVRLGVASGVLFKIWDVVNSRAAIYRCLMGGLGASIGFSNPSPIDVVTEGKFNSFTTRRPVGLGEFDSAMLEIVSVSLGSLGLLASGPTGFSWAYLEMAIPSIQQIIQIRPFEVGNSIQFLPTLADGRRVRGKLELLGRPFRYTGPRPRQGAVR